MLRSSAFALLPCVLLTGLAHAQNGAFSDQTALTGIVGDYGGLHSFTAGGAVGDFDRDGDQDVFYPSGNNGPDHLWINDGTGVFTDEATAWGVDVTHRSTGAAVGDYDGDGWLDIYVTSHGTQALQQPGHHKLYRNTGQGGFVDMAAAAGVQTVSTNQADGWGAAWGDIDLDGDLDLAVCGWQSTDGNRLYENNGDGTFTDVTISAGVAAVQGIAGFAPRFCDMDGDRYPEIVWIGDFSTSMYWVNDGDGTFTNGTFASGTSQDGTEMGSTIGDWDEDGDWDIYVTTINSNNLYINQGGHVYSNMAAAAGVVNTGWGWGAVSFDMNHDTRLDLMATAQNGRNYCFRNDATAPLGFTEVGLLNGLGTMIDGRGMSNFDVDNDGDQDVVVFPYAGTVKVWRNDITGPDANWLRVFLERGDVTDIAPNGVGSVVKVKIGTRTLMGRIDGASNYMSQSELSAHFGLGSNTVADEVRVEWTNGDVTVLTNVDVNQHLTIAPPNANLYCPALENSAGTYSLLVPTGTAIVANNDFGLYASDLPQNEFGIFVMGTNQALIPLFSGNLCITSPFTRLLPVVSSGTGGETSRAVDVNESLVVGQILVGTRMNFQLWYRDGPVNQANLTNGVEVVFE